GRGGSVRSRASGAAWGHLGHSPAFSDECQHLLAAVSLVMAQGRRR
ncbi:hypothetical protein A2U01_0067886, partial [Trifolium medium]|nr:hypothetical protein [Trifolium medium]